MPIQGPTNGLVQELLNRLEALSTRLNKTIQITSGRREGDVNASAHNSGIAADFYVAGMNSIALSDEIVDDGFTGVGEYYQANSTVERFAHADIRGLPGSERSGAYGPGGNKSAPLCWYRVGEQYTYGSRRSGRRCPSRAMLASFADSVDIDDPNDSNRVRAMRAVISEVVEDLDPGGGDDGARQRDNKKRFMLHVAGHEGKDAGEFLKARKQVPRGPGRSFFQMEAPRAWDAFEYAERNRWLEKLTSSSGLTEGQLREAARDLPREPGEPWPNGNQIEARLAGAYDMFGAYMARIALKRIPNPIGMSNREHAIYWADHWKVEFDSDAERDRLIGVFEDEANDIDDL